MIYLCMRKEKTISKKNPGRVNNRDFILNLFRDYIMFLNRGRLGVTSPSLFFLASS